jgi:CelD/BcsL family acetyltransferase involved in cellulose biosynthesis
MLSKPWRKHLRRLQRTMLDSGRATVRHVTSETQLARGFDILVRLHNERWRRRNVRGAFEDPRFERFHRDAAAGLLAEGALEFSWIEIDGRPVAAEYLLSDARGRYAYQGGIDPDALDLEPGRLAAIVMLRQAIDEGCAFYDFLRGDEEYKAHLRAEPRSIITLRLWSARPSVRLRRRVWQAIDTSRRTRRSVRQWLKSRLQGGQDSKHSSRPADHHKGKAATVAR